MSNTLPPKGAKQIGKIGGPTGLVSLVNAVGMDFRPNEEQRDAKCRFWAVVQAVANYKEDDYYEWDEVIEVTRVPAIAAWSTFPGFSTWFFDKFENEQKVAVLWDKALMAIEQIILNDDPKVQGARINAVKLLMEMRKGHKTTRLLDESVQRMSVDELRLFVQNGEVKQLKEKSDE